ncbi:MAG TPA: hypothetical protein VIG29_21605, partial [Vicinamibacteria bacterium]
MALGRRIDSLSSLMSAEPEPVRLSFENSVAFVTFDLPGEKVNKLSRAVMERLMEVLSELESRTGLRGAV